MRGHGKLRAKSSWESLHVQQDKDAIPSTHPGSASSGDDEEGVISIDTQKDESTASLPKVEGAYNSEGTQAHNMEPMG
eukprot:1335442-Pyramimonas_sp.AAC.1